MLGASGRLVAMSMARKGKQRIPNDEESLKGIPVSLANAQAHLDCAALLAEKGFAGPARSLLILSIEESEKARTLGQIVLGELLTETEIHDRLHWHLPRYRGALRKSWSRGATATYAAESLRERLKMKPKRSDHDRWQAALAQHPDTPTRRHGSAGSVESSRYENPSKASIGSRSQSRS